MTLYRIFGVIYKIKVISHPKVPPRSRLIVIIWCSCAEVVIIRLGVVLRTALRNALREALSEALREALGEGLSKALSKALSNALREALVIRTL